MNRLLLIFMFVCLAPSSAHAQCAMPSGPPAEAGVIIFNDDHKVMQYCNGDKWIGLWGGKGGGGLPACANGDIAQFTAGEWRCGNGSTIDNLNASNLKSGTVPTARLGTGAANNTTFLRGDGAWAAPSGGGISAVTTATCSTTGSPATCTVSCPAGYYRTGCSFGVSAYGRSTAIPSGSNACYCDIGANPGIICYAICAR